MARKHTFFKPAQSFQTPAIARFLYLIEQQKQILDQIQAVLPSELKSHVRHCVVNHKKLIIYTDAATWASQLRFYSKVMLAAIAPITTDTIEIMQVKLLVAPAAPDIQSARKANVPSLEKINFIRDHGTMIADEKLKHALLKLSATLERLSGY
jgi:hypothetical protein